LYKLTWSKILLKKYEGEEVLAAFSTAMLKLVTLNED